MMCEQQQQQQQQVGFNLRSKQFDNKERMKSEDSKKLEIVDLSGMSLNSLPNPFLNLAAICKLDLSNNNLQSIPESLTARLLNVMVLDVHSNKLKSLPIFSI